MFFISRRGCYGEFVRCDRPDLQDTKHSVGIEVTIAVEEIIARTENYGVQRLGKIVSPEEEANYWGEFYLDANRKVLAESPTRSAYTVNSYSNLNNTVEAKQKLIDVYRQAFSVVGLYVFVPDGWPDEFDPEVMKNELLHEYDFLILKYS